MKIQLLHGIDHNDIMLLKRYSINVISIIVITILAFTGCGKKSGSNIGLLVALVNYLNASVTTNTPVLNNLQIPSSDSSSIILAQPTFATPGTPPVIVEAFIGIQGTITVTGSNVTNFIQGNIDASSSDVPFTGLAINTDYSIVVVAQNSSGYSVQQINQSTNAVAPVLNDLSITASGANSITVAAPTFSTAGLPAPQVDAYIGEAWTMSLTGQTVTGQVDGPVDASAGYIFNTGLNQDTLYRIIVIAHNATGYSIKNIYQSTSGTAPVLNPVSISATDSSTMTLAAPTLSFTGNPLPEVYAYIGIDGTITVAGSTVTGAEQGPVDLSTAVPGVYQGYQFSGLSENTTYRVIVVAKNSYGNSSRQILQGTGGMAPVLRSLYITSTTNNSITLGTPYFSTAGNPAPQVDAYIGPDGLITVTGQTVGGTISALQVPFTGAAFTGLATNTTYRIIVVAHNTGGYSVEQIVQSTGAVAPVLSGGGTVTGTSATSITINVPTFSTGGNPAPTIEAYIGVQGTITVNGSSVENFVQGPVSAAAGCTFSGLSPETTYSIYVIAHNSAGYSILNTANQGTGMTAPVMNALVVSAFDATTITLAKPTFSTAGNPLPSSVQAFIGLNGTLQIDGGGNVTGQLAVVGGPYDVSDGGHQFTGLTLGTAYRIIVRARYGASSFIFRDIFPSTSGIDVAPILNDLSISAHSNTSITLAAPTYHTPGVPAAAADAYIGLDGTISVTGSTVSNAAASQVPYTTGIFGGLSPGTRYRIIVVAHNGASSYSVRQIVQGTGAIAPVLNDIAISNTTANSITVAAPTYAVAGSPTPTLTYYIGPYGVPPTVPLPVSVNGSTVSNYTATNTTGSFAGLAANTEYRIIVIARNGQGYSVKEIVQRTGNYAPVLNDLSLSSFDANNINVATPTFATAGYPAPTVTFYIGLTGGATPISIKGSVVSNATATNFTGNFSGLTANTQYRIYAVAQNATGYSVRQIVQRTTGATTAAPVLDNLILSNFETGTTVDFIELERPILIAAGNPSPTTVRAYFGEDGVMSWDGSNVTGTIITGPIDVSTGGYQFLRPTSSLTYKIIVVAQNATAPPSEKEIILDMTSTAPVLNSPLSIVSLGSDSIELKQPTMSTMANPKPTMRAYIGEDGSINFNNGSHSVTGTILEGPIDVSTGGYQFRGLTPDTDYRIYVVAEEGTVDADNEFIVQRTRGRAPVLNDPLITVTGETSATINLSAAAFTTTALPGTPTWTTRAYIGLPGGGTPISVSCNETTGCTVSNYIVGQVYNVNGSSCTFTGLAAYTNYRIYVVSQTQDSYGTFLYDVTPAIDHQTRGTAPVLSALSTTSGWWGSWYVDLAAPSSTGTPAPTMQAWIGVDGTISYNAVTHQAENFVDGPYDVTSGGYTFYSLTWLEYYRVIVVAHNYDGYTDQYDEEEIVERAD
jgi:hypothetical protein